MMMVHGSESMSRTSKVEYTTEGERNRRGDDRRGEARTGEER